MVKAWDVCFIDDVVRSNPDKLTKVLRYIDNNPTAEAAFKTEFNLTAAGRREDLSVISTSVGLFSHVNNLLFSPTFFGQKAKRL